MCMYVHFAWKGGPRNNLYCVGWNVIPYTLSHSRILFFKDAFILNIYLKKIFHFPHIPLFRAIFLNSVNLTSFFARWIFVNTVRIAYVTRSRGYVNCSKRKRKKEVAKIIFSWRLTMSNIGMLRHKSCLFLWLPLVVKFKFLSCCSRKLLHRQLFVFSSNWRCVNSFVNCCCKKWKSSAASLLVVLRYCATDSTSAGFVNVPTAPSCIL